MPEKESSKICKFCKNNFLGYKRSMYCSNFCSARDRKSYFRGRTKYKFVCKNCK